MHLRIASWGVVCAVLALSVPQIALAQNDSSAPPSRVELPTIMVDNPVPLIEEVPQHVEPPPETTMPPTMEMGRGGMGDFNGFGSPVLGHMMPRIGFQSTWMPDANVKGQNANLSFWQFNLTGAYPIWQDSENEWSMSTHVRAEVLQTGATLPPLGTPFPDQLWNVSLGTSFRHLITDGSWFDGSIIGASIHIGSASDVPFHSLQEANIGISGNLRVPQGEHNAWIFSLSFSTNSQVLNYVPVPGIAYFWCPSPWFQATIGFPFANLVWRPSEDWTVQLDYALLTNVRGRIIYRVMPTLRVYVGFDSGSESYYLEDRTDSRDRFFYNDLRVTAGAMWHLPYHWSAELSGGYAFDRYYFEGRNFSTGANNRVDIGDVPFVSLRVEKRF